MAAGFEQLVVRLNRPWLLPALVGGGVLLAALSFLAGFWVGSDYFAGQMIENRQVIAANKKAQSRVKELEQEVANSAVAREIDRESLEEVRQSVVGLQATLAEQKEELDLYRNLLRDNSLQTGLHIDSLRIATSDDPSTVTYRLVVKQKVTLIKNIKVRIDLEVSGKLDGAEIAYTLAQLDPMQDNDPLLVSFKYFRMLEGTLHFPADFEPLQLKVSVAKVGDNAFGTTQKFLWKDVVE